ncbi:MazG nucleotide pyrophosphohydrolase domain-containing protein [Specibacter sp. RAF43]|uniref:MazG nucleotide pyrophosphohydrolase domain-containing protein n=1 Tax=Specibacter sp. RAF43 TaxID=3233057 RepID=UPI003F974D49
MTRTNPALGVAVERLAAVITDLREHCLWTAALTHESLITYLIEESYELADVVEAGPGPLDVGELKGELGDILYQVMLHSRLQEEAGGFTLADVADHLREKLVRRNSHVFRGDGTLQERFPQSIAEIERNYAAAKSAEGFGAPGAPAASVYGSLPASLPALALAAKTLDRAVAAGLGGTLPPSASSPGPALSGPSLPGPGGPGPGGPDGPPQTEDELGELLFDVVRAARARGLDAERALRNAVRRYQAP